MPRLASYNAGKELRKQDHQDHDDNSNPEKRQAGGAPLRAGFPKVELD